jgi:hypothetical protein
MPDNKTARLFWAVSLSVRCRIAKKEIQSKALFAYGLLCNIQKITSAATPSLPLHLLITLQIITHCLRMLHIPPEHSGQHIRKVVLLSGAPM